VEKYAKTLYVFINAYKRAYQVKRSIAVRFRDRNYIRWNRQDKANEYKYKTWSKI